MKIELVNGFFESAIFEQSFFAFVKISPTTKLNSLAQKVRL